MTAPTSTRVPEPLTVAEAQARADRHYDHCRACRGREWCQTWLDLEDDVTEAVRAAQGVAA